MSISASNPRAPASRGSLLIVDDETALLEAVSRFLGRQGYDVHVAATGREALEVLSGQSVEVMLCDVGLPDMEAPDLVAAAREAAPGMQVLMFSGWHDPRIADRLLAVGASAYVTKPMPLQDLHAIVEKAIQDHRGLTETSPES